MTAPMVFTGPASLRSYEIDLIRALSKPIPAGEWPKEKTFVDAEQPRAIAKVLTAAHHDHLKDANIGFVFRKEMKSRHKVTLAKASLGGAKLEYFADVSLLIEVNWTAWKSLSSARRVALIDHELTHFDREEVDGEWKYILVPHDVEEFSSIVDRWGAWTPDLQRFRHALASSQADLFND